MRASLLVLALGLAACDRPSPDAPATPGGGSMPDTRPSTPDVMLPDAPVVVEGAEAFIDDGAGDAGFAAFRDTLRDVVARRDTLALLGLVSPTAQLSYDDAPGGPDGLRALWFDADPPEPVWSVLDRVLSAGSVEEDGAFTAPYVAGLWPDDLDPTTHVAAVGEATAARDTPGGREVARLSGVLILPLADSTDAETWHVVLPDGTDAYIPRENAVSPIGHRATFWPDEAQAWKLQVFVSGA